MKDDGRAGDIPRSDLIKLNQLERCVMRSKWSRRTSCQRTFRTTAPTKHATEPHTTVRTTSRTPIIERKWRNEGQEALEVRIWESRRPRSRSEGARRSASAQDARPHWPRSVQKVRRGCLSTDHVRLASSSHVDRRTIAARSWRASSFGARSGWALPRSAKHDAARPSTIRDLAK